MDVINSKQLLPLELLTRDKHVIGVITVNRESVGPNVTSLADWHHYVIILMDDNALDTEHQYNRDDILENDEEKRIVIHHVPICELLEVTDMRHSSIKHLITLGNIEYDRDHHVVELKQLLTAEHVKMKEQQLFEVFAAFVDAYMRTRRSLTDGNELDAFQHISKALSQWAIMSILETSEYTGELNWSQVKESNPGVHKLYEELIGSDETIVQRIELVLLACEFSINTKLHTRLATLIRVLRESNEGYTIDELQKHPDLQAISNYIPMVMEKLKLRGEVQSSYILPAGPWNKVGLIPIYRWNTDRETVKER